jgi:Asp-tRNA(Asn)/Glu-tRNA(Gln) amidotransferase A subunit family amidase
MTKTRLLPFVIILFFAPSQSFQQAIAEIDEYNAFISFVDKKTVAKETKNIKAMSLVPIAVGVKDNIDIQGLPNTAGSIALQNNKPKKSAY